VLDSSSSKVGDPMMIPGKDASALDRMATAFFGVAMGCLLARDGGSDYLAITFGLLGVLLYIASMIAHRRSRNDLKTLL
jgi:hypothetical protein